MKEKEGTRDKGHKRRKGHKGQNKYFGGNVTTVQPHGQHHEYHAPVHAKENLDAGAISQVVNSALSNRTHGAVYAIGGFFTLAALAVGVVMLTLSTRRFTEIPTESGGTVSLVAGGILTPIAASWGTSMAISLSRRDTRTRQDIANGLKDQGFTPNNDGILVNANNESTGINLQTIQDIALEMHKDYPKYGERVLYTNKQLMDAGNDQIPFMFLIESWGDIEFTIQPVYNDEVDSLIGLTKQKIPSLVNVNEWNKPKPNDEYWQSMQTGIAARIKLMPFAFQFDQSDRFIKIKAIFKNDELFEEMYEDAKQDNISLPDPVLMMKGIENLLEKQNEERRPQFRTTTNE